MKRGLIIALYGLLSITANGQTVGEISDSVKQVLKHGSLKDKAETIKGAFASKAAKADEMVGTWTYVKPAVLGTSGNLIFKTIGNTYADELASLLDSYFEKAKVTPQNTSFTFREDGTFNRSLAGRKAKGVWMVGGDKLLLGIKNVQTGNLTTHLENDTLTMVVEVSKLMTLFKVIGIISDTKTNNALIKLSKHLSGIQGGFLMARKQRK